MSVLLINWMRPRLASYSCWIWDLRIKTCIIIRNVSTLVTILWRLWYICAYCLLYLAHFKGFAENLFWFDLLSIINQMFIILSCFSFHSFSLFLYNFQPSRNLSSQGYCCCFFFLLITEVVWFEANAEWISLSGTVPMPIVVLSPNTWLLLKDLLWWTFFSWAELR